MSEQYKGYVIDLEQDCDIQQPCEDMDMFGTLLAWHERHSFGEEKPEGVVTPSDCKAWLKRTKALYLPVYMYDHSGLAMNTTGYIDIDRDRWDWGQLGVITVTPEKAREEFGRLAKNNKEKVYSLLRAEVETWSQYAGGDVWVYSIHKEGDEETLDSVGGIYGMYHALGLAKEQVDYFIQAEGQPEGDNKTSD